MTEKFDAATAIAVSPAMCRATGDVGVTVELLRPPELAGRASRVGRVTDRPW